MSIELKNNCKNNIYKIEKIPRLIVKIKETEI